VLKNVSMFRKKLGFTKYLQILQQYITNFAEIYFIIHQKSIHAGRPKYKKKALGQASG
jgi:hypothetical protein